jgi:acyl carrier protein
MQPELEKIVAIVCRVGSIAGVGPDEDFYDAGVSSVAALTLLLELEDAFATTIPDDQFVEMRTARQIYELMSQLTRKAA